MAESEHSSRLRAAWIAAAVIGVGVLWWAVFSLMGRLWWQADLGAEKVPPPARVEVHAPRHDWVDLDKYSREHPVWEPARE